MPEGATDAAQARLLRALAHPARLQIAEILCLGEACVCHLEAKLGLRQAYVSQQVSVLREAGLLEERREGAFVFLRLARPEVEALVRASRRLVGGDSPAQRAAILDPECGCPKCRSKAAGMAASAEGAEAAPQAAGSESGHAS